MSRRKGMAFGVAAFVVLVGGARAEAQSWAWSTYQAGTPPQTRTYPKWKEQLAGAVPVVTLFETGEGIVTFQAAMPGQGQWKATKATLKIYRIDPATGTWRAQPTDTFTGTIAAQVVAGNVANPEGHLHSPAGTTAGDLCQWRACETRCHN